MNNMNMNNFDRMKFYDISISFLLGIILVIIFKIMTNIQCVIL